MGVSWLESSEFKWVDASVSFKGPRQPPVGVNVLNAVAVWSATYGKDEKLLCSWPESECA